MTAKAVEVTVAIAPDTQSSNENRPGKEILKKDSKMEKGDEKETISNNY